MTSKQRCNLALFGLGRAGLIHFQNILANHQCQLLYVVEADKNMAQKVLDEFHCNAKVMQPDQAQQIYEDQSVAAVMICSPTYTHEDIILTSLKHGKSVFCEKPISGTFEGVKKCYELAKQVKKPLLCSFNRRFDPSLQKLQAGVRAGNIGKIHTIKSSARDSPCPTIEFLKHSGGLFHDTGSHDIDLLCWVLDEYPQNVYAMGHCHNQDIKDIGDLDTVAIMMKFPGNALAVIDYSRNSIYGYDQRCEAYGSEGMLISENQRPSELTHYNQKGSSKEPMHYSFPQRYSESYIGALRHFVEVIQGESTPMITEEQVLKVSKIAEACEESYKTGLPVQLTYD